MPEQIYKFDPSEVWFTSDTHFGHENIIRYCGRPFCNAEEMNVIAQRVSLLTGNIRYVYIGSRPLDDFRYVPVEAGMPISMADIEKAVNVL